MRPSGNHLPNLLIGTDNGTVLYAANSGTLGNPQFKSSAVPLKGVLPPGYHYFKFSHWYKSGAYGAAYELVGHQSGIGERLCLSRRRRHKYALKFWVWPYKNQYFQRYYMPAETELTEHIISCDQPITIQMNTRYKIHFWIMSPQESVSNFRFYLHCGPRHNAWSPPGD